MIPGPLTTSIYLKYYFYYRFNFVINLSVTPVSIILALHLIRIRIL